MLRQINHLGNCSQSAQATRVRQAIERYLDNWLTVGMDWEYWMQEVNLAKHEFARLINADVSEIAVSTSASEAVASIASGLNFQTGLRRKVVTTEAEFPTVAQVWLGHQKYGCKVEFVPVRRGRLHLEDFERYIDQETAIVSTTHVYYQNGYKQDLAPVIDIAHRNGALVLVDAYQSLGTTPVDVKALDVDLLVSGNLKYLLGTPGIAFVYVKKDIVPMFEPAVTGWFGQENPFAFNVTYLDYARDARRFDTGTPPIMAAFAARAGMQILNEVGIERIGKRIDQLSQHALRVADELALPLLSPREVSAKGATTAIKVPDSHLMEEQLKRRDIIASARGEAIRIAPHFFTTEDDITAALWQIRNLLGCVRE
ncbi:MAG: aminotransferase class V-fold PLP-dependent enzyme [Bacillota bacterium]